MTVTRLSGGGPASSPRNAWKNRCAVAGSDTATTSDTQSKNAASRRFAAIDRLQTVMLNENVANRTCDRRRASRRSTDPPIAKVTMAASSAETGWMLKV